MLLLENAGRSVRTKSVYGKYAMTSRCEMVWRRRIDWIMFGTTARSATTLKTIKLPRWTQGYWLM